MIGDMVIVTFHGSGIGGAPYKGNFPATVKKIHDDGEGVVVRYEDKSEGYTLLQHVQSAEVSSHSSSFAFLVAR